MKNSVSIKGTREGLTITLGEGELEALIEDLRQHLSTQGAFFRGGRVALEAGQRALSEGELRRLNEILAEYEMTLRTVVAEDAATQQAARALGMRLVEQRPAEELPPPTITPIAPTRALDGSKGILVRHLVRSGQIVRHTGHVIIIGDVNAGAEIIAGGDVVIWGRLFGTVHAGAMGNATAVVCALELAPLQLRIGELVARAAENSRPKKPGPEVASVREGQIIVEPWDRATFAQAPASSMATSHSSTTPSASVSAPGGE
jgi:septum site-determining protein MinC